AFESAGRLRAAIAAASARLEAAARKLAPEDESAQLLAKTEPGPGAGGTARATPGKNLQVSPSSLPNATRTAQAAPGADLASRGALPPRLEAAVRRYFSEEEKPR
ncbi:MAG TPA: hypothetical protein VHF22_00560, partial [Planctomycetota bacterium]|nr:hypothetical protein [Planctomycetota bacterium]